MSKGSTGEGKGSPSQGRGNRRGIGRFSSRRKQQAVERLIRGEDLDLVSRELGVTAAMLSSWREDYQAAGQEALKSRPPQQQDDQSVRLKAKIGELTMANELLYEKIHRMEETRPLVWRRLDK